MKVSKERLEQSRVLLNIELETEEMERSLERAYHRLVARANVPGFRKGKAPRATLERYLGREALLQDALDHVVPEVYQKALQEQEVEAIAQPEIEITQAEPVTFKATVAVRPTVTLGDYRQLIFPPDPVEVAQEEVDSALERLRHFQATWEPVERPVQFGDLATLDVEGQAEGKNFLKEKGLQYQVLPDFPLPVPGFGKHLEGMEKGTEREFTIAAPPDSQVGELAGKECLFKVAVSEVKEERLSELNDEFAKSLGEGFETMDALREKVTADLKARAEAGARREQEEKIMEALGGLSEVEFPLFLVEEEIGRLLVERRERSRGGGSGPEVSLADAKKTEEELREELRPLAEKRVKRSVVLGKVAEEEKIEVAPEEVDADVERMAQQAGEKGGDLRRLFSSSGARQSLERALLTRKTVERLVEIAGGEGREKLLEEVAGESLKEVSSDEAKG